MGVFWSVHMLRGAEAFRKPLSILKIHALRNSCSTLPLLLAKRAAQLAEVARSGRNAEEKMMEIFICPAFTCFPFLT